MDAIQIEFARAGLPLELRTIPLGWDRGESTDDIVQIDIARAERRKQPPERFRIYPGHEDNRVEVLGFDRSLMQLVLLVDEPSRSFTVRVASAVAKRQGLTVVRKDRHHAWALQSTDARERRFLCGMDEQHLFIALLPDPVSTVRDAHASLRDPRVDAAERGEPWRTRRQGEWFFVALPEDEERAVANLARKTLRVAHNVGIAQAAGIRRLGREHLAEEVLVVSGIPDAGGDTGARVYVRGAVKHPDHRTLVLDTWCLTVPNREAIEAPIEGVGWID
jgi:hypothetical protein